MMKPSQNPSWDQHVMLKGLEGCIVREIEPIYPPENQIHEFAIFGISSSDIANNALILGSNGGAIDECDGCHKAYSYAGECGFRTCLACNEKGLIKCHFCSRVSLQKPIEGGLSAAAPEMVGVPYDKKNYQLVLC
ncbi:hypothetical protein CsatA_016729 [Cannabis sativa]